EAKFGRVFAGTISGREDFKDDLRPDAVFDPLFVGAAVSLGATEDDHRIGGGAGFVVSLDGIPQQVAGDEYVRVVAEQGVEPAFDGDDPLELAGVVGHRLTVIFGLVDLVRTRRLDPGGHGRCGSQRIKATNPQDPTRFRESGSTAWVSVSGNSPIII